MASKKKKSSPPKLPTAPAEIPSDYGEAKMVSAFIFGMLGIAVVSLLILNDAQERAFALFLKGQAAFDLTSGAFWEMLFGFFVGAAGGFFIAREIPREHSVQANAIARGAAVFLIAVIFYIPAMTANFIWDDDQLLTVNPAINPHLAFSVPPLSGLKEFWVAPKGADYFPLTSSTLWLEYQLWGSVWDTPEVFNGYHVVNILLHAIGVLLLWRVLLKLGIPGAWWAAAIFAVHPVGVESVAWVSECKNTLSQIFFFLTLLAFFDFEKTARQKYYIWAIILFVLAMLAKTSVAPMPFVLLLIAWWKCSMSRSENESANGKVASNVSNQPKGLIAFSRRFFISCWRYIIRVLNTDPVSNLRERELLKWTNVIIGSIGLIGGILALLYLLGLNSHFHAVHENQKDPIVFATHIFKKGYLDHEFWFLAGLCIASSIFGILIGIFGQQSNRHIVRTLAFFQIAALLGSITIWFQYGRAIGDEEIPIGAFPSRFANLGMAVWFYLGKALWPLDLLVIYPRWNIKPPELWEFWGLAALVAVAALCWICRRGWGKHVILGFGYYVLTLLPALGLLKMSYMRLTLVADHFQYLSMPGVIALIVAAVAVFYKKAGPELRPLFVLVASFIVCAFAKLTWAQASIYRGEETLWANTLGKNPDSWQAHNHYGAVMFQKHLIDEAYFHFGEAVRLKPENPESHNNLGLALVTKGRMEEGIAQYREAVRIKGDEPSMRTNLANALASAKHYDEAIVEYKEAIKLNPNDPSVHVQLGYIYIQEQRLDEAISEFEQALKIAPNMTQARQNLEAAKQMKRNQSK